MTRVKSSDSPRAWRLLGAALCLTILFGGWPTSWAVSAAEAKKSMKLNETAPDFSMPSQKGDTVSLIDFAGKKIVVLYFYPKDNTPVCTAEACAFRDAYQQFTDAGAVVIGVSSNSGKSHDDFASKHHLPFILISDEGGKLRKKYGVPSSMGIMPGRVTYVIDKQGKIRHIFNSQLDGPRHVKEALEMIRKLNADHEEKS